MDASVIIREMSMEDYTKVMALWSGLEGLALGNADTQPNIRRFLKRNAGLCFVAENEQQIVGAILCGHDGRRGYLHHLAVSPSYRKNGIARRLVANCLNKLKEEGISKCHLFVFANNQQGMDFWQHIGFHQRNDINIFSQDIE
ncbi:Acetyltransferase YpeA [Sporomusa ovata DSM 2662]|uniref:Acetyltransferase n=2 Tax=Sporomusa ovata TaxID=2378 RepID=A0A0U1L5E3_9FIRM|nr:GNAT family N-acetyltransferase [Sporomusa ovata]EQB28575.1 acetyltransferase [Sporomusa ovata DSM 2662]CQR74906.1 Acetyltransferase [Sporomusa ovata]